MAAPFGSEPSGSKPPVFRETGEGRAFFAGGPTTDCMLGARGLLCAALDPMPAGLPERVMAVLRPHIANRRWHTLADNRRSSGVGPNGEFGSGGKPVTIIPPDLLSRVTAALEGSDGAFRGVSTATLDDLGATLHKQGDPDATAVVAEEVARRRNDGQKPGPQETD